MCTHLNTPVHAYIYGLLFFLFSSSFFPFPPPSASVLLFLYVSFCIPTFPGMYNYTYIYILTIPLGKFNMNAFDSILICFKLIYAILCLCNRKDLR